MVEASKNTTSLDSEQRADVLLVTATLTEARAVLKIFEKTPNQAEQRLFIDDVAYFDLGIVADAQVLLALSEAGTGGPGGSQAVIEDGIRQLSPAAVILVGIAFGLDQEKQAVGDILVSRQLFDYEFQRIGSDKTGQTTIISAGDRPHASPWLFHRFRTGVLDWQGARVAFGLILSGDKLVDNQDFRDQLRELAPLALGGEMEGHGLYSAAYRKRVDWILVKAISDWADGHKNENRHVHRQLAAENAARFVFHVLKQGGFAKRSRGRSPQSSSTHTPGAMSQVEQGRMLYSYTAHSSYVLDVGWSRDGNYLASAGGDGIVRVWEAATGLARTTYEHKSWLNKMNKPITIYTLTWSPDGQRIVSAGHGPQVHVWNAAMGQTLALYEGHSGVLADVFAVAWAPDGKRIASACSTIGLDKTVHIWNPDTGQMLFRYPVASAPPLSFAVSSLAWSPDGTRLAVAGGDKIVRVWNIETDQPGETDTFRSEWSGHIAWSPDSRYLAFMGAKHTVCIRDMIARTTTITCHGHTDSVRSLAWSPDGRWIATASNDRTARIWEASTGEHLYLYKGHSDWVTSLAWSPDGTRIASASNDKTVQIWAVGDSK